MLRNMAESKKRSVLIVIAMIMLITFTRAIDLKHNMNLHGDEHVFFNAAQSLKNYLLGSAETFEEEKEYPEGAYVFQLPFHILSAIYSNITGNSVNPCISGRLAAIFYFTLGAVLGCAMLYRFFSKKPIYIVTYALIMIFSLLHIEQSRYGTGDPITFPLLMAIIILTAQALDKSTDADGKIPTNIYIYIY